MSFRLFLVVTVLGPLLAGCVSTGNSDSLEQIERNHNAAVESAA